MAALSGSVDAAATRRLAADRLTGGDARAWTRISQASDGYVLSQGASDIVRHSQLLRTVPQPGELRVVTTPGRRPGTWHVDVAGRDRAGLLAACSGALAEAGLDVVQAVIETWPDGGALEAFIVGSSRPLDGSWVEDLLMASLSRPFAVPPVPDAIVNFSQPGPSSYTGCEVRACDRHGLLHALAVAIATAGADIHAASVSTEGRLAIDRFDLSDRSGRPLSSSLRAVVRSRISGGVGFV